MRSRRYTARSLRGNPQNSGGTKSRGKVRLEVIREREQNGRKVVWYWFNETLITPKGNWRKSPPGVYFDPESKVMP